MRNNPKSHFIFGIKIILYLFFAGVGGGASAVGTIFHILRPQLEIVIKGGIILGAPLVLIGSIFLLLDLGQPKVAWRAISRPNKAWISRGTIILTTFIILGFIQIGTWIWPFQGLGNYTNFHLIFNVINGVFGVLTLIYTGFLFDTTRSIPFWSTPILPLLFLVSGLSMGIFGLILITMGSLESHSLNFLIQMDIILIILEALIIFFYLHGMHEVTAARASVKRLLKGDLSYQFWLGVVFIGILIPFFFEILGGGSKSLTLIACLAGLIGGFFVRFVIVSAAEKTPLNVEGVLIYLTPRPK
jgi:formate-dependent nitrite reductase membrane component NrfD